MTLVTKTLMIWHTSLMQVLQVVATLAFVNSVVFKEKRIVFEDIFLVRQ